MLHLYIHRDGTPSSKKEMDFLAWKKINEGIGTGGTDVPDRVLRTVFNLISQDFHHELSIASAKGRSDGDAAAGCSDEGGSGPDEWSLGVASEKPSSSIFSSSASLEGWTEIVGGGFPRPRGLTGVQNVTCRQLSSIFSEVTNSSGVTSNSFGLSGDMAPGVRNVRTDVS